MKKAVLAVFLLLIALPGYTQNLPRLISRVDTLLNINYPAICDSASFYYTGNRTDFDSCITYYGNTAFNITGYMGEDQTFDATNNILTYITRYNLGNGWYNDRRAVYTYDVYNRRTVWIQQEYYSGGWQNYLRDSLIYDNNNNVVTHFFAVWNGAAGVFEDHEVYAYAYDANHNILSNVKLTFNYNTATLDTSSRSTFTYNAYNQKLTQAYEDYNMGNWQQIHFDSSVYNGNKQVLYLSSTTRDSFIYDANDDLAKVLHSLTGAVVKYHGMDSNVYDNAHNKILSVARIYITGFHWSWKDIDRYRATYNSYHQPTLEINETWNDSAHSWLPSVGPMYFVRYHYEHEDVSVKGAEMKSLSVKLYPNPASSFLTIDMSLSTPEKTQVAIYSVTGALMMQWNEDAATNLHRMVPVNSFPAGNYIIRIKGKETQQSQLFTVAR